MQGLENNIVNILMQKMQCPKRTEVFVSQDFLIMVAEVVVIYMFLVA